jgi:fumarate reductase subunit D
MVIRRIRKYYYHSIKKGIMNSTLIIGIIIIAAIIVPLWYLMHKLGTGKRLLKKNSSHPAGTVISMLQSMNIGVTEYWDWTGKGRRLRLPF